MFIKRKEWRLRLSAKYNRDNDNLAYFAVYSKSGPFLRYCHALEGPLRFVIKGLYFNVSTSFLSNQADLNEQLNGLLLHVTFYTRATLIGY